MECCICLDKVENIALTCQRCKRGIVCTDCFGRMDEAKCPLCRFVHIDIEPPEIYLEVEREPKRCCRLHVKKCIVSTCWTIMVGFTLQLLFNAIVNNVVVNIIYMFLLGWGGMILVHCFLATNSDCQDVDMPYDCCIIHDV